MTGTHTGTLRFTIEAHDSAPPAAGDGWEEVVETTFVPGASVSLVQWAGEQGWDLDLDPSTDYRARYCATGFGMAREPRDDHDGPAPDRYLLMFWPAVVAPDAVLRQTTPYAAYWHDWARKLPPPGRRVAV
ncbi:hypothetical protein ACFQX7_40185 [Luedemannella flava]